MQELFIYLNRATDVLLVMSPITIFFGGRGMMVLTRMGLIELYIYWFYYLLGEWGIFGLL